MISEDRRLFQRQAMDFTLRFKDYAQDIEGKGFSWDIAAGGAGIFSKQRLAPQDKVSIWVDLPDNYEPLNLYGEVVWSSQVEPDTWRVGIKFKKIYLMGLSRIFRLH